MFDAYWEYMYDYKLVDQGFDLRQRQRMFPLASLSSPALRPTQFLIQWVPWVLSRG
jgi:hypothetical protein